MTRPDPADLFPLAKAARALTVPPTWLREEIEAGRLPGLRAGKALLVHLPTVEAKLAERAAAGDVEGGDA